MKKTLIALIFACGSLTTLGQDTLHEYLAITNYGNKLIVAPADSAARVFLYEVDKGEESLIVRDIVSLNKVLLQLVQEYEVKGWSVFTVYNSPNGTTWIMRKPKQ